MKGKNTFTLVEIKSIEELITLRNKTSPSGQKSVRQKMRNIGFYGKDDWGIIDLQVSDLRSLIKMGHIKVIGDDFKPTPDWTVLANVQETPSEKKLSSTTTRLKDLKSLLENFKINRFDPNVDSEIKIVNRCGNYIICLRKNSKLPSVSLTPILTTFEGLDVLYTGIASINLRTRDYRQHFKGNNAGCSTLRKSLGVLFGYLQIPRDKNPNNGKTKFSNKDEQNLSEWMQANLIMFFLPSLDFNKVELNLIDHFNPPLNLKDNHNQINLEFRKHLSSLRSPKSKVKINV